MVGVCRWLEGFCEDISSVVGRGYSPDSHYSFHVILLDFVVTDVNRACVFGHIGLCSDVLLSLIVRVEVVGVISVASALYA